MAPDDRFIPADEVASQMGGGVDPANDALLQALTQIRQAQTRPLIANEPFAQLGAGLEGLAAGFRGQVNPAVRQALAVREQQMSALGQQAQTASAIARLQMAQQQMTDMRRARDVAVQAEQRKQETEDRKAATEARKADIEGIKLKLDVGKQFVASGVPSAVVEGNRIVIEQLGKLGYAAAPGLATSLAKSTVSKEQKDQIVSLLANNVPLDHITKQMPTVDPGYIKILSDAIARKDDFALKSLDMPSVTEIETAKIDLALKRQKLANAQAEAGQVGKEAKESTVTALRHEFNGLSKNFIAVKDAFQRVQEAATNPSAMGDVALIFGFMKILDPISVVREGEFATAANSGSVPTRIQNLYNKALAGERLAPEQRADMLGQARRIFSKNMQSQQALEGEYRRIAGERGAPPSSVIVDHVGPFRGLTDTPMAAKAPPPNPTRDDYQAEARRLKKQFPSLPIEGIKQLMRAAGWQ